MKQNKQPLVELTAEGQLFVKMPTGKTITLDMEASDTIKDIKQKLKDLVHIPCKLQQIRIGKVAAHYAMVLGLKGGVKKTMKKEMKQAVHDSRKMTLRSLIDKAKSMEKVNYIAVMGEVERLGGLISSNNSQQAEYFLILFVLFCLKHCLSNNCSRFGASGCSDAMRSSSRPAWPA